MRQTIIYILLIALMVGAASAIDATGGTITYSGIYTIHTFNSSGNFNVTDATGNMEIFLVGGGGGAGGPLGGGGGAGGIHSETGVTVSVQNYAVTVGAGGAGGSASDGSSGSHTTLGAIAQADGGGGGAYYVGNTGRNGLSGASGGGASVGDITGGTGGTSTGQGSAGGDGRSGTSPWASGGGGGAGAAGQDGDATNGGDGGAGNTTSINGSSVEYSCGGGGGTYPAAYAASSAGCSSAGAGETDFNDGYDALPNHGGGGGGGGAGSTGGDGGSGVVIIKYITGAPDYVLIQAYDSYTYANLLNFSANVTFNGTETIYTTTNGSIYTTIEEDTGDLNVTVSSNYSGGYFEETTLNHDSVTTSMPFYLHQAEITFYAQNKLSGASVDTFNASSTNNTAYDTNPTLNLTAGSTQVNFSKLGWYIATESVTTGALNQSNYTFEVFDHVLNVSIYTGIGSAGDNEFTADLYSNNYSFHEQLSTTTGVASFNITAGNYTIWINDSNHTLTQYNFTLNASLNYTAINITVYTQDTFNLIFRNETTNQELNNTLVYIDLISNTSAASYNTSNGSILIEALVPETYTIKYWIDTDVPRDYYLTLADQSFENITLYTIDEDISTLYLPVVSDADDQACSDNTVSLMRYFIDINGYRVVEMAKTDTNGQGVLRVQPDTVNYKLLFSGTCGTFTTAPQKIVDATNGFTVIEAQGLLTSSESIAGADINITYINDTQTYVFSWVDSTQVVTEGCLNVYRTKDRQRTLNYSACSEASTGSLLYTLSGNLTETEWEAQGTLDTNTEYSFYSWRAPDVSFNPQYGNWGAAGIFWALIILLAIVLVSSNTASGLIFSSVGTLIVLMSIGMIAGTANIIGGLVIVGAVLLYKIKSS